MWTGVYVLLDKTNLALKSKAFSLSDVSNNQKALILVNGLTGTNKAYLQIQDPIDNSWSNVMMNGSAIYCDVNNNIINLSIDGRLRIDKQGTDNVGVSIQSSKPFNVY